MSKDIFSFQEALTQVRELLHHLEGHQTALEGPAKIAIRAVWRAVDQTRLHLAAIRAGREKGNAPKQELVDLWSDASLAISDIDPDFAHRLRRKAEYWSDPKVWRKERGIDISIESVAEAARDLLPHAVRDIPVAPPKRSSNSDVFVSHAREDKAEVARPLADGLNSIRPGH